MLSKNLYSTIYDSSPVALQNAMLALYGLRNRARQKRWQTILRTIAGTETWSQEAQVNFTATRLSEVLLHAIMHVPRYSGFQHLRRVLAGPPDEVLQALHEFPAITRLEVLAEPEAYLSKAYRRRRLICTRTSGTTGTPFTSWLEPQAVYTSDALWWRRTVWAGYSPGDWIVRLVGDPVVPLSHHDPVPVYRRSWTDRRLYLSTYHLSAATAPRMAEALMQYRPAFLMGYPSALDSLVRLAPNAFRGWVPKAILFSSEPMHDHQREAIERAIPAPVRALYGCAERIISAAECESGSLHLSVIDGYVENQFDGSGSTTGLITGLLNKAMPLIRFQLGDRIAVAAANGTACNCGRTLPRIEAVITKAEDCVLTSKGRSISPSILTWAFKDLAGIQKSQIVQLDDRSIEVRLQTARFEELAPVLVQRLRKLVFDELEVRAVHVDEIPVSPSGKTRFVIRQMPQPIQCTSGYEQRDQQR